MQCAHFSHLKSFYPKRLYACINSDCRKACSLYLQYSMHKIAHHVKTCPSQNCHRPPPRTRVVRELDVLKFRGTSSLLSRKYLFCEKNMLVSGTRKRVNFIFNHNLNAFYMTGNLPIKKSGYLISYHHAEASPGLYVFF